MNGNPSMHERRTGARYHFDRHTPQYREQFATITHEMHEKCPVAWSDTYGGHWVAASSEAVFELARCPHVSNDHDIHGERRGYKGITIPTAQRARYRGGMLEMDDPEHRLYRDVLEAAGEKQVVFRTVDIGGDKNLPYLRQEESLLEENPAMGWRALRLALERDGLLKVQARALLEAAGGRVLNVMFPMVSEAWEFDAAKEIFDTQIAFLRQLKKPLPRTVRYGVMLEVPSLAEQLDLIAPKISFLSIGTNDLTQFLFAADRSNPKLAERYDWLSTSIVRFLFRAINAVRDFPIDITVCGEMGGRQLEAMALLGLGIRRLSITPASVGPIKQLVASIDLGELEKAMASWLAMPPRDLRGALARWAAEHGVAID